MRWRPKSRGAHAADPTSLFGGPTTGATATATTTTATSLQPAHVTHGVELDDVSRRADSYPALHRAQLRLPWGRVTAFTGPPDSGVTTLLALIATQLAPHSGDVLVAGRHTIHDTRRARAALGWVSSEPADWGRLRVREVLEMLAAAHGVDSRTSRARVGELLAATGLAPLAAVAGADLSVAQRRLLTLAGAMVHGPRVVVLDEPFTGLEADERADLVALLGELAGRGMTLALGAGEAEDLYDVADRIIELEAGRLVASHDVSGEPRRVRWRIASVDGAALRARLDRLGVEHTDVGDDTPDEGAPTGSVTPSVVEVTLAQDRDAADLLAALVQAGVPVHGFVPPAQRPRADTWPRGMP